MTILDLPFKQDSTTMRFFDIGPWRFYFNIARKEGHRPLLGKRLWISRKTKPTGLYTMARDGHYGFVHRLTAAIREQAGIKYLQVVAFAWWIGVVRKDVAEFKLVIS